MKFRKRSRVFAVLNAFCPTGGGGGSDPTCSPYPKAVPSGKELVAEIEKVDKAFLKDHKGYKTPGHLVGSTDSRKDKDTSYFGTYRSFEVNKYLRKGLAALKPEYEAPNKYNPSYLQDKITGLGKDAIERAKTEAPKAIEALRAEFEKTSLKSKGETVYRRVDSDILDKLSKGSVLEDKGFMSTTISHSHGRARGGGASLIVKTAEGTPMIYYGKEAELLFPEGTKLKITKIVKEGSDTFVHATMQPYKKGKK